MRTYTPADSHALYARLIAGGRAVVSEPAYMALIDHCGNRNRMDELASCQNRHRCGTLDGYVAWIGKENQPADLEMHAEGSLYAVGSAE